MPQAIVISRPGNRSVRERSVVHYQQRRWSILSRSLEGESNCGKSRLAARFDRPKTRDATHARSEPARPVRGRQQRSGSKLWPFTPARVEPPWHCPVSRIQMEMGAATLLRKYANCRYAQRSLVYPRWYSPTKLGLPSLLVKLSMKCPCAGACAASPCQTRSDSRSAPGPGCAYAASASGRVGCHR